jgi:hypothetical protein
MQTRVNLFPNHVNFSKQGVRKFSRRGGDSGHSWEALTSISRGAHQKSQKRREIFSVCYAYSPPPPFSWGGNFTFLYEDFPLGQFISPKSCCHVSCPCAMSILQVHAACPCLMSLLHVFAACPCCMPVLIVSAKCPCCMSILNVHTKCPYCMSILQVHAANSC